MADVAFPRLERDPSIGVFPSTSIRHFLVSNPRTIDGLTVNHSNPPLVCHSVVLQGLVDHLFDGPRALELTEPRELLFDLRSL